MNREHLLQFDLTFDRDRASDVIARCLAQGKVQLGEMDSVELLKCYDLVSCPLNLRRMLMGLPISEKAWDIR